MSELKKICLCLDELTLEYFDNFEEMLQLRQQMDALLKDGYFFMAKARYSMGTGAVTSLQYNVDDLEKAVVTVQIREQGDSDKSDSKSPDSNVRYRKINVSGAGDSTDSLDISNLSLNDSFVEDKSSPEDYKDPIRWFGILVPQALRKCQEKFQKASQLSCHLASVSLKHKQLSDMITERRRTKKALLLGEA